MYILGREKQNNYLESLELISESGGGWVKHYQDQKTDQKWITFQAYPESHGGGIKILRKEPPPEDINTWLHLCFESDNQDDINGLGMELSVQYDAWQYILVWLEENSSNFSKDKLTNFIDLLGMLIPRNRQEIVGKSNDEVEKDYQYYIDLSYRAKKLIENI